jgi:glycosyltransferase involved in cell wall biosynthesis
MKVLLLNQCFYPDTVSTAQHLADLGRGLIARGHSVTVIASARGYDNPELRFAPREEWQGIRIIRVRGLALGKSRRWRRALDFASFMLACAFKLLFVEKPDVIVALTSPPLISFLAAAVAKIRRTRYVFWVMDLNPDEAIAAGWLRKGSMTARVLSRLLQFSLRNAERIVVLDRFMRERILAKGQPAEKIEVIPPWSHDSIVRYDQEGRDRFRRENGLSNKFVVMYAGNHSPCHPLDTLLEAARELHQSEAAAEVAFVFVGGGSEFAKVKAFSEHHSLSNIKCLGYQPLEKLPSVLSAADLQVVVMGNEFVGLVHPCKVYNILAASRPVLYIGPVPSHVVEIFGEINDPRAAAAVQHGDTAGAVRCIRDRAARRPDPAARFGIEITANYSMNSLLPRLVAVLESVHANPAACYTAPEVNSLKASSR